MNESVRIRTLAGQFFAHICSSVEKYAEFGKILISFSNFGGKDLEEFILKSSRHINGLLPSFAIIFKLRPLFMKNEASAGCARGK